MNEKKTAKQMAKELDQMTRDVTSEEADFLEEVLGILADGKKLKPKMAAQLEGMYDKYLVNREDVDEGSGENEEQELEDEME